MRREVTIFIPLNGNAVPIPKMVTQAIAILEKDPDKKAKDVLDELAAEFAGPDAPEWAMRLLNEKLAPFRGQLDLEWGAQYLDVGFAIEHDREHKGGQSRVDKDEDLVQMVKEILGEGRLGLIRMVPSPAEARRQDELDRAITRNVRRHGHELDRALLDIPLSGETQDGEAQEERT